MQGDPAVALNHDGRLEVFVRGSDNVLYHIWQTVAAAGPWSAWSPLPGESITSDPAVARNLDGRLEVFAIGSDGALWHIWQKNPAAGPWFAWTSLGTPPGGGITGNPSAVENSDGRLEAFVCGPGAALWHIWQITPGGHWSEWNLLGGVVTSDPVAIDNAGRLEVFASGAGNALYHMWQTVAAGGPWSAWTWLGNPPGGGITGDPAVASNFDGRLEVFAVGSNGALWHIWQTAPSDGPWFVWTSLGTPPGGGITGNPSAVDNSGRLEAFVCGPGAALWHIWQTTPGGAWSEWNWLGGVLTSDPVATDNVDGRLEVFASGPGNALYHIWQTEPADGPWLAWESLGTP
jgi:hypothetical protein